MAIDEEYQISSRATELGDNAPCLDVLSQPENPSLWTSLNEILNAVRTSNSSAPA